MILNLMIRGQNDGIMIPIPQYPLYSALLTLLGGTQVPYDLDESKGWATGISGLSDSIAEARSRGTDVRGLAVINPGNPTGQVLPEAVMRDIIHFCANENIVLMADEVYQDNIWCKDKKFLSFKKVLRDLGPSHPAAGVQLASFHSVSKGFLGECGRRGGYVELTNFDPDVKGLIYKTASISLCSNVGGQVLFGQEQLSNQFIPLLSDHDGFAS